MTNRYLNMPGTDIIKDSYGKISAAFDSVQADMDGRLYNIFRQSIINGNFDVWQRGTSFTNPAPGTYTADRWKLSSGNTADGGTLPNITISRQVQNSGDVMSSFYFFRLSTDGAGISLGANAAYRFMQSIENGVRTLAGPNKVVTISFYAKSSIANKKIGVYGHQYYGSGGSPSALENLTGSRVTLSTSWTRYTVKINTNTLIGKTFGTNNDDCLNIIFVPMWGVNNAAYVGDTVAETFGGAGTIDIAQVQVNVGDTALPFQPRSYAEELALCQRYYERIDASTVGGGRANLGTAVGNTSTNVLLPFLFKTQKRVFPSLTQGGAGWRLLPGGIFIPSLSIVDGTLSGVNLSGNYSSGGLTVGSAYLVQSVDGSTSWIAFDAEL